MSCQSLILTIDVYILHVLITVCGNVVYQYNFEYIDRMKKGKKKEELEILNKQASFLAHMSHEIRTPLNVIMGVTDILSEETFNQKEHARLINLLKTAEEHLMLIINNILDISKIESGTVELAYNDFELNDLLGKIYEMLNLKATSKEILLSYEISPNIPVNLVGDAQKLKQVLINLISNAIKFTHVGYVKIRIIGISEHEEFLPLLQQQVQYLGNDEVMILFEISDTGIGIESSKINKIFHDYMQVDPSITSQYGGTGLGLVISKKLVNLLGGDIFVESELGKGSKFYFTAKFNKSKNEHLVKNNSEESKAANLNNGLPTQARNILLVDDSGDNRMIIQMYLEKLPYRIDTAENGLIAVAKVKSVKYDLILMDIEMPVMDGYTAVKKIKEWEASNNLPHTPILALSANAFEENIQEGLKKGFTSYLTKPIKKAVLIDAIEKHVFRMQ